MLQSRRARAHRIKLLSLFVALPLALLAADPALAEHLPPPEQTVSESELAPLSEMLDALGNADPADPKAMLTAFDKVLQKLPEPTKFRGVVQFYRAGILTSEDRSAESQDAIEESIRLLPEYSGPLILAAWIYSYSDRPGTGADYLLRASRLDPGEVRKVEDYEIGNLLLRLRNARDDQRVEAVSQRLLEIGWTGTGVSTRSGLALEVIERKMEDGDVAGSRALISKLLLPTHSRTLLVDNRFKDIWPDVEKWAGPKQELQWAIYLAEARDRWQASKSLEALGDYSQALLTAGHDETAIRELLPQLQRELDPEDDYDLLFLVSGLAGALARQGRWQDVDAMYQRAEKAWPLGSSANALNIAANRAKWLLFKGSFADGLKLMDAAIADARARGPEVNSDALGTMQHYRACLLHELGRDREAEVAAAIASRASRPATVAFQHLCMGNEAKARQVLIDALSDDNDRDDVLIFVQRSDEPPVQSDYGRKMSERTQTLRSDPALLSAVAKYGRVLPYSVSDGAPPESGKASSRAAN